MRLPIILLLSAIFISPASYDLHNRSADERLRELIAVYGQALVTIDYPGFDRATDIGRTLSLDRYENGLLRIILTEATIDSFMKLGLPYKIVEPGYPKAILNASSVTDAMQWQSYPTYTQYDSIVHLLASQYPELCRVDTIGESVQGRLILSMKISSDVSFDDPVKPELFFTSTMHGDELAGFVLMLRLAEYLLENYGDDPAVTSLLNNLQIYINPISNPDGTYRSDDYISNPRRANSNGFDLNRNYPSPDNSGVTLQKETIDMIAFMEERRFVLSANFHSGAEVLNYPWDRWLDRIHADDDWFVRLCREYADTVHLYARDGYMRMFDNGIVRGAVWYAITGSRMDFVTYELQGREVTIELDNTKITPADSLESLWQYNYRSLLNYLAFALNGVKGTVTDSDSGMPLFAEITIAEHDRDNSQVYSCSNSGTYLRMLDEGVWDIQFSAAGYHDTVVTGVATGYDGYTTLDVEMRPLSTGDTAVTEGSMVIMPNPAAHYTRILLPAALEGEVTIRIVSIAGRVLYSAIKSYYSDAPLLLDTSQLPPGLYLVKAGRRDERSLATGMLIIR